MPRIPSPKKKTATVQAPKPEFLNYSKFLRAEAAIAGTGKLPVGSVELKAVTIARGEKLEGEALLKRVYTLMGGALK